MINSDRAAVACVTPTHRQMTANKLWLCLQVEHTTKKDSPNNWRHVFAILWQIKVTARGEREERNELRSAAASDKKKQLKSDLILLPCAQATNRQASWRLSFLWPFGWGFLSGWVQSKGGLPNSIWRTKGVDKRGARISWGVIVRETGTWILN